ncbi:MAG: DeoR/GlpR family DNA-binding transcription regulator [Actinobacteria bacterium]|nr:DeoR/GlpR family DNA-binding transcription regulator [Actinomycetota bacterium]
MKIKERRQKIVDFVNDWGNLSVGFLAKKFNVSEMTIYRDLNELESEKLLIKTSGGAIRINESLVHSESSFSKRLKNHNQEKKAIAKKAVEYISNGDSIIIDGGTTSFALVKEINKTDLKELTILTNNIIVQLELIKNQNVEVIAIGGIARQGSYSTVGEIAENVIKDMQVDKIFVTSKGISSDGGIFDPHLSEGKIKSLLLERARKKILVVDSNKFGIFGFYKFANVSDFDVVIIDSKIQDEHLESLRKLDINLEIVSVSSR